MDDTTPTADVLSDYVDSFFMDPKVREEAGKTLDEIYESNVVLFTDQPPASDEITTGDSSDYDEIDVTEMTYMDWIDALASPEDHAFELDNMPASVREYLIAEGDISG
jgi:hypothetical protein